MPQKIQASQCDFSFGEVDPDLKRNDAHPARKGGLRQMSNARIHNSGTIQNRSGRRAQFPLPVGANFTRIEKLTMAPGSNFELAFGVDANGFSSVVIYDATGNVVASFPSAAFLWTAATTNLIRFAQLALTIYLTFPGMVPQTISWDGVAAWSTTPFVEMAVANQKRTFFYRISPQGIALLPGAQTGAGVSLVASAPLFKAGHVGTRMRFINRQMLITAVANSTNATVTVEESLPGAQDISFSVDPTTTFAVGDVVIGSSSGSKGIITFMNAVTFHAAIQLINTNATVTGAVFFNPGTTVSFTTADTISGPGGSLAAAAAGPITSPTVSVSIWDEEVMNAFRGYPASCFVDQYRLGFCDFPSVPNGIGWSAINSPNDLYVGGTTVPNGAIFELAPNKVRIYDVVPGPEGSEFVFADKSVSYIPINETNPLRPGSVAFKKLSGDGAAHVQPRLAQEAILYINAGGNSPMAVIATGAYQRPFNTKSLGDFHSHLFNNVKCIAAPNADGTFNERYAYVLNGDGSIVVGKYSPETLSGNAPVIGWGPWSGLGAVKWLAAYSAEVLFTTAYFGATICEILDDTRYLDGSLLVNALPAPFTAPGGKGPLWWIAGQSVFLMDQGTRPMGTYLIDANGFLVPQNNGGENLAVASLVAGQSWTGAAEPFAPDATSGADMGQRMKMRAFSYFAAYVLHSTGFKFQALFSSKQTRTSPPLGTPMNERRFPAYNMDDDTTVPPIQRETVETYPPQGTTYDPRVAIVWDTPGPFQLLEIAMEITP